MNTVSKHLAHYPHARSSTLSGIIARERMTEQLRKEVAAKKRRELWSRVWKALAGRKAGG